MARRQQRYDLDRQTRFLNVYKHFPGGLKTIDTDDALGAIFLRDVENLSLSEFTFLEKRYGTYKKSKFDFINVPQSFDVVQGYFEYKAYDGVHKLIFINGKPYIKLPNQTNFKEVEVFHTEEGLDYPDPETLKTAINFDLVTLIFAKSQVFANLDYNVEHNPLDLTIKTHSGASITFGSLEILEVLSETSAKVKLDYEDVQFKAELFEGKTSAKVKLDYEDVQIKVELFEGKTKSVSSAKLD